jgi:hypothetical protein
MNAMIDSTHWKTLSEQAKTFPDLPSWARELCDRSFGEIHDLGKVSLETKKFDQSYIDFLQEQIEMNARGAKWSALLQRRMDALEPSVGKDLGFLSITTTGHVLWVRFDPDNYRVLWVEAH